ncbi:hypothetical protein F4779DRAFT_574360 [Xylariaceae sp. FL0662B]|nr:hypothetical protein F4779DRAFT_574360 [Xylariaceae sp. FL0662B]
MDKVFVHKEEGILKLDTVLGWDLASALPLWEACQPPMFLRGPSRTEVDTPLVDPDDTIGYAESRVEYDIGLEEYKMTRLRTVFLDRVTELAPEWMHIYKASSRKRDLSLAIRYCTDASFRPIIESWLEDIDTLNEGNTRTLQDRIYQSINSNALLGRLSEENTTDSSTTSSSSTDSNLTLA